MRASSTDRQTGHVSRRGLGVAAVVAAQRAVAVEDERDVAVGQRNVAPQARQWSAGAIPRRLRSRIALPPLSAIRAELREQRRRERVAGLAPQVDDLHRRQLAAEPLAELEPLERSQLSGRGVALPYTATAPSSAARLAATVRAS